MTPEEKIQLKFLKRFLLFVGISQILKNINRDNYIELCCRTTTNKNVRDLRMKLNYMFDDYEKYIKLYDLNFAEFYKYYKFIK